MVSSTTRTPSVLHSSGLFRMCMYAVIAAVSVANIVKSSLGPVGLDKMLVDDVGVRNPSNTVHAWSLGARLEGGC